MADKVQWITGIGPVKFKDIGSGQYVAEFSLADALTSASDRVSLESDRASYSIFGTLLAPDTTTTTQDIIVLEATTMVVRLVRFATWPVQTTAAIQAYWLAKRSTLNSGGTSTTLAGVPRLSTDPAATAVIRKYTAKPTSGALVNYVRSWYGVVPAAAGSALHPEVPIDWDERQGALRQLTLPANGTECLGLVPGGAAMAAGSALRFELHWTEAAS